VCNRYARGARAEWNSVPVVYIGGGVLVVILIVILIVILVRRV
jgi:hypothetical protein